LRTFFPFFFVLGLLVGAQLRPAETRHFAIVDELQGAGYQTGHMWLAVPPFDVVDMTLRAAGTLRWQQRARGLSMPSCQLAPTC
jgi:hypothetical protein